MNSRILFVTTNGVGLGHVTRSMAVARRLGEDVTPIIFTLSQAVPIVRSQGFLVEYLPSADSLGTDRYDWQLLLARRLALLCETYDPAVVVFDGASPYHGLCARILEDQQRRWVWSRRAMWRPGRGAGAIALSTLFDLVIEPGEIAAEADRGATVAERERVTRIPPVLLYAQDEVLGREAARERLGLAGDEVCALVQLGAGSLNDISTLRGIAGNILSEHGVRVVVGESPLSAPSAPSTIGTTIRTYPLQPLLGAFDLAVAAPGYNSFHELLAAGVPTVFAPNTDTQTDDQLARSRYAQDAGLGRSWEEVSPDGFRAAVEPLLDPEARESMRRTAGALRVEDGAAEAARLLERMAQGEDASTVTVSGGDGPEGAGA